MGKLFLKLFISLMVVNGIANWVYMQAWERTLGQQGADLRKQRFGSIFSLTELVLDPYPVDQWPERFKELEPSFSVPTRLQTMDEVFASPTFEATTAFPAAEVERFKQRLRDGLIIYGVQPGESFLLEKRLRQTQYVMVSAFDNPPGWGLTNELISWATMGTLFALAILFWVWPFWKDLKKLMGAAEEIGAGRFDTLVKLRRGSPLTPLATSFNAMTGHIGSLIESHKSLTNAVSHELRTPLARLRFGQSLAMEDNTLQGKDSYLAGMERDIAEMDELTRELLTYAKLEREAPPIDLKVTPAAPWADKLIAETAVEARNTGVNIDIVTHVETQDIACEPRYMARAAANLLRNALRYARTTVSLTLEKNGAKTYIHVDDDGPGIPVEERAHLFEPFSRLDQSRTRATGGFGLGLSIVKQIAVWHRGDAAIGDSPLGGARVTISW